MSDALVKLLRIQVKKQQTLEHFANRRRALIFKHKMDVCRLQASKSRLDTDTDIVFREAAYALKEPEQLTLLIKNYNVLPNGLPLHTILERRRTL